MKKSKKNYFWLSLLFLIVSGSTFLYMGYRAGEWQRKILDEAGGKLGISYDSAEMNLIQDLLGLQGPKTYLVLFLNNTELRPGGGFIGVYAVVQVNVAKPDIIKVEGTEILDNNAPKDFPSVPPQPIKDYLKVERWYFRDSNWSPDFILSSEKSLELYQKERGLMSDDIDAVVGFTPTVLEEFLGIIGPVVVDGIEFNKENFTEKLEYEVEYGFEDRGISFDDRKNILKDLTKKIVVEVSKNFLSSWNDYKNIFDAMTREKQIMFYSPKVDWQDNFIEHGWAGEMKKGDFDYFLWADANLGALKTDAAMDRDLKYEIYKSDDRWRAKVTMKYNHQGRFDWRTTRYLSFSRVYVPLGTKLVKENKNISEGDENGRAWFGQFVKVEPGQKKEVSFEFILSPQVASMIEAGDYALLAQKQLGTNKIGLTLSLDFGKTVGPSEPRENTGRLDDNKYDYIDVFDTDKFFQVNF